MPKKKELTEREQICESLEAFIEYAEATKKYADAGSYKRILSYVTRLEAAIAEHKEVTETYGLEQGFCEALWSVLDRGEYIRGVTR